MTRHKFEQVSGESSTFSIKWVKRFWIYLKILNKLRPCFSEVLQQHAVTLFTRAHWSSFLYTTQAILPASSEMEGVTDRSRLFCWSLQFFHTFCVGWAPVLKLFPLQTARIWRRGGGEKREGKGREYSARLIWLEHERLQLDNEIARSP